MSNVPTLRTYRVKGVFWSVDVGGKGPAQVLIEDENGELAYWWLSYALTHSDEIADFHLFSADIESGKIRLYDEDDKLWRTWRHAELSEPGRMSTQPLSTS